MERFALVLGCDVMKGTVTRASVYGHDSSRLLTIGLPFVSLRHREVCVCFRVPLRMRVSVTERNTTNLSEPLMSLCSLLSLQMPLSA